MRLSLDIYDSMPMSMKSYIRHYGWHFNKKAYEYACEYMFAPRKDNPSVLTKVPMMNKEEIDSLLSQQGVTLKNNIGYDYAYVAMMCKADYYGKAIEDSTHLAKFISDTVDDPDAGDGEIMRCWYAKMISRGIMVDWEELI